MITSQFGNLLILIVFILGYVGIILEHPLKLSKSAVGLFIAVICWMFYFISDGVPVHTNVEHLSSALSEISQILFFLLGAMTIVELIDSHRGFTTVIRLIQTRSKKMLLLVISLLAFFLSAVLDNLTTTILMTSILRKLVPYPKERLILSCMVVIAANAGGAWTPIGDVTTTMLWINGQVSTHAVLRDLFIPSLVCMLIPMGIYMYSMKGEYSPAQIDQHYEEKEPGATIVFALGLLSLISVPLVKWVTGLPPFMGVLFGLAVLWGVTDLLHHKYDYRQHLRIPSILTKIDVSSILFFLGILLAVESLNMVGMLEKLAIFLNQHLSNSTQIATAIGLMSAIVDNVPLVAASMGMYDLVNYPMDSSLWLLIAYAAGTGGSILIIGSSSGVAMMGMEKIDFITYMKKATIPAFLGFVGGILVYLIL